MRSENCRKSLVIWLFSTAMADHARKRLKPLRHAINGSTLAFSLPPSGKRRKSCRISKTILESAWHSGQIVAWVVLLFVLLFLCVLPFILGGVSLQGLGKLSPSSPLFALCVAV